MDTLIRINGPLAQLAIKRFLQDPLIREKYSTVAEYYKVLVSRDEVSSRPTEDIQILNPKTEIKRCL